MRAGRLRHRVTIEAVSLVPASAFNDQTETWSEVATVWAHVEPVRARETIEGQRQIGEITHTVRMRCPSPGATPTSAMRLKFEGRTLNIVSVVNVGERDREFECVCQEVE
jgi:SPP1 family predicted phage head-tail adaptor